MNVVATQPRTQSPTAPLQLADFRSANPGWLIPGWFVLNLIFGSIPLYGENSGFYLSQLMLVLLMAYEVLRGGARRVVGRLVAPIIFVVLATAWTILSHAWTNERYVPEFLKAILLIVPAIILRNSVGWRDVLAIARLAPPIFVAILVTVLVLGIGDYYGDEGRFGVPWLGSPNNTGFVIAILGALCIYDIRQRWRVADPAQRTAAALWPTGILAVLIGFLIFTGSHGGVLSFLVVVLSYLGVKLRYMLAAIVMLIVGIWLFDIQLPELIGSGRPLIWGMLIDSMRDAGWSAWAVGFGPGSINITTWFTALVQSAHSMYIETLYNYGVPALLLLVYVLFRFGRVIGDAPLAPDNRRLIQAIFGSVVVGFIVDTYMMSAQLSWFGAFILSCGGLALNRRG